MDEISLEALEFDRVVEELAGFASTLPGKELIKDLKPSTDPSEIDHLFREFLEIRDTVHVHGTFPLSRFRDIRDILSRLAPEGVFLLPEELTTTRELLGLIKDLTSRLTPPFEKTYPILSSIIASLGDYSHLASEIDRILDEKGQIRDEASGELYTIRKEIISLRNRARKVLDEIRESRRYREILQDEFFTIRDDRYVLGVKAGMHTELPGIIHGRSGSGLTYFIEPFRLVDLNNRLAILKKEERAEEIRILKEITGCVHESRDSLLRDIGIVARLDLLQAKALFAERIKAIVPEFSSTGDIRFTGARHPLLVLKELRGGERVVGVDIIMEENHRVLVISGANTGGKTVSLKTLGLLTLMVQSGIPVPCMEGSRAVVFKKVFADIGDRQNILASLSTFSSHIEEIKRFVNEADSGSLVLIDEIGVGTDPHEGGILALSILETLRERGARVVVTSHLNILKAHAQIDPSFMNASVEFDEETLKPLYRLRYGRPGESFGISIAGALGMPEEVIERARKRLSGKEATFVESIRELEEEKRRIAELKERLILLERKREEALKTLREKESLILQRVRERFERLLAEAERRLREMMEGQKEKPRKRERAIEDIRHEYMERLGIEEPVYIPEPGDGVELKGSNTVGEVLKVDREARRAELRIGSMRVWVSWNRLCKRPHRETHLQGGRMERAYPQDRVTTSINLVGMRVDEALRSVQRFLDDAHASGIERVEIIHGIGTGRLKKAVEEYLKETTFVRGFHPGDPMRGGAGVTVVELA